MSIKSYFIYIIRPFNNSLGFLIVLFCKSSLLYNCRIGLYSYNYNSFFFFNDKRCNLNENFPLVLDEYFKSQIQAYSMVTWLHYNLKLVFFSLEQKSTFRMGPVLKESSLLLALPMLFSKHLRLSAKSLKR